MIQTVGAGSILGMAVSLVISIGLPVALAIIVKKKTNAWFPSLFIGAGVLVVFALLLESIMHNIVFSVTGDAITGNIWLYALYGGLAAGLFEETGRLIAMKTLMKKHLKKENSLMYGVGHGGIESVLLVGVTYVSNLIIAFMINSGSFEQSLALLDESQKAQSLEELAPLWTEPAGFFFVAGIERISAIFLQICLSYLVYRGVKKSRPGWYALAILLHALVDGTTVIIAKYTSVYLTEAVLFVLTAIVVCCTGMLYRKDREEETDTGTARS